MKKLLSFAVAALSIAAVADVSYSPTIGVTEITTTNKNTIVAVPFTSLGGDEAISVTDLVCTNGIDVGSWIYVFKAGGYKAWHLGNSGWEAATTANEGESDYSTPTAGDENVASPGAIWVILKDAPAANEPKSIFIYGNYTNPATSVSIAAGNNLIANPLQTDATITIANPTALDQIIVPNDVKSVVYTYAATGKWCKIEGKKRTEGTPEIPVGQGFWYISKATGTSNTSVSFTAKVGE